MDTTTILIIVAACLAVSEALTLIPAIKSNGIFQMIYSLLKAVATGMKK